MTTDDEQLLREMWCAYTLHATPKPFCVKEAMRAVLAVVREHDGRDAEHEALRVARVEISALFAPIPDTDQWGLAARLENEADRECLWKAFNALRSVDAAIARGKHGRV